MPIPDYILTPDNMLPKLNTSQSQEHTENSIPSIQEETSQQLSIQGIQPVYSPKGNVQTILLTEDRRLFSMNLTKYIDDRVSAILAAKEQGNE